MKQKAEYILEPDDVANSIHYQVKESETVNTKLLELKPPRKEQFRGGVC